MGGATRSYFLQVLDESLSLVASAGAEHLVIGGLATRALLGDGVDPAEDVDLLVKQDDAERLLDVFSGAGYATYRRDEGWIYKVGRPDVTIDLIFRAGETIRLDAQHLERSSVAPLDGHRIPVPAPEDLVVMKAIFDADDDRRGKWYGALSILRRFAVDWAYLVERGRRHAPNRVLSLLLYATDAGIAVPEQALVDLAGTALQAEGTADAVRPIP